ncbi:MAG: hypothetical protein JF617_09460 [Burkholderiales bacterium]|nr:hypothetical protein [Burkholderiales bacterium]
MGEKAKGEKEVEAGESLDGLDRRFRQWRESRRRGEHIPPQLWEAAVGMARKHGVPRIANKLRLDIGGLSRRMEGAAGQAQASMAETKFVELFAAPAPAATIVVRECVIELENARGVKMRVELNGQGLAGLAHLCSGFWSAA